MRLINLVGQPFGRLTVVARSSVIVGQSTVWECRCECGNLRHVPAENLKTGKTQSCGCFNQERRSERMTTHGRSQSREYDSWICMRERCNRPTNEHYKYYGGRGITVCARWQDSFANFFADMGSRPLGTTLDRFPDNDGNYEPANCRWATAKQQSATRRQPPPMPRGADGRFRRTA